MKTPTEEEIKANVTILKNPEKYKAMPAERWTMKDEWVPAPDS